MDAHVRGIEGEQVGLQVATNAFDSSKVRGRRGAYRFVAIGQARDQLGLVGEDDPRRADAAKLALGQLAEASGGEDFYPIDLTGVESVSPEIATAIRK